MKDYANGKILVTTKATVTTVVINRPEVRNALDNEAARGLGQALQDFDDDKEQLAAVLTGVGGRVLRWSRFGRGGGQSRLRGLGRRSGGAYPSHLV